MLRKSDNISCELSAIEDCILLLELTGLNVRFCNLNCMLRQPTCYCFGHPWWNISMPGWRRGRWAWIQVWQAGRPCSHRWIWAEGKHKAHRPSQTWFMSLLGIEWVKSLTDKIPLIILPVICTLIENQITFLLQWHLQTSSPLGSILLYLSLAQKFDPTQLQHICIWKVCSFEGIFWHGFTTQPMACATRNKGVGKFHRGKNSTRTRKGCKTPHRKLNTNS